MRAAAVTGWLAVIAVVGVVVLCALPVQSKRPEVDQPATAALRRRTGDAHAYAFHEGSGSLQDCGSPLAFVLAGRTQKTYGGGSTALERAREAYANDHRCSDLAAGRLRPAGVLLAGTVALGIASFALTYAGRSRARRVRAAWVPAGAAATGRPAPPPPPPPAADPDGRPSDPSPAGT